MFLTQDEQQLKLSDNWETVGMYCETVDGKVGHGGYGEGGYQGVIENATKELYAKHGPNVIVINTKVQVMPGNAHPSYNRRALMITGDIYRIDTEKMYDDALKRHIRKDKHG